MWLGAKLTDYEGSRLASGLVTRLEASHYKAYARVFVAAVRRLKTEALDYKATRLHSYEI